MHLGEERGENEQSACVNCEPRAVHKIKICLNHHRNSGRLVW
jgi:hypothetical protein